MNIIAIDIGNTNIAVGLFLDGVEQFIKSISGGSEAELAECLKSAWAKIPVAGASRDKKRDGVLVVSSVKDAWTDMVEKIAANELKEKIHVIGRDVPLPMPVWVDEPCQVGTDRVVSAAAAYETVQDAVVVADFGTAVTIDLVDVNGAFLGGAICPGFDISAGALQQNTARLPKVNVHRPAEPYGKTTDEAINCGLYYSAVGTLEEVIRRYAEKIGKWPHTVVTGAAGGMLRDDCGFIDSFVPDLAVKGIVLAYRKHLLQKP
jgi:type III pantothenate kinase